MVVISNHEQCQIKHDYVQDQHDHLLMIYYKLYLTIEELNHNYSKKFEIASKWKFYEEVFTKVLWINPSALQALAYWTSPSLSATFCKYLVKYSVLFLISAFLKNKEMQIKSVWSEILLITNSKCFTGLSKTFIIIQMFTIIIIFMQIF